MQSICARLPILMLFTVSLALAGVSTAGSQTDVIPRLWLPLTVKTLPAPVTGIRITHIEYDPPGSDVEGEFVAIQNQGATNANMHRWKLSDAAGTTYVFPPYTMGPGVTVRVWTKAGADTATDLYWASSRAIWTNTGDRATLRDAAGNVVDTYCYLGGCP